MCFSLNRISMLVGVIILIVLLFNNKLFGKPNRILISNESILINQSDILVIDTLSNYSYTNEHLSSKSQNESKEDKKIANLAITAFILAILSVFSGFFILFIGPPTVVFALLALKKIKKRVNKLFKLERSIALISLIVSSILFLSAIPLLFV